MKKLPKGWKEHRKFEPISIRVMGYSDELICPHGVGHDAGVHGCEGCCALPEIREYFKKRSTGKVEANAYDDNGNPIKYDLKDTAE